MQTRQDGENRFLARQHLLMEHLVGLVELRQSRGAVDDGDGIDILKLLFTVVDGNAQLFSCSCGKDIYGISHGRAWEEFGLQFVSLRTLNLGNVQPTLRQRIRQHHARTTGMRHDGEVLTLQFGQREDATHRRQFLTRKATDDARLTEQGLNGRV